MNDFARNTSADDSVALSKAQAHFAVGRYSEAADLFQELLNQSDKPEYRHQLAQCYLQRALGEAAKGQFTAACESWENYASWAEPPIDAQDRHVLWLLLTKDYARGYAALESLGAGQLDQDYPELAVVLGFLLVSGQVEIATHIPQDSAFFRHWSVVQEALVAFRNGDSGSCDQALKTLPFRSAFRDFRSLLKTQLLAVPSAEQAQAMLAKIPSSSPYRSVAEAALADLQTGANFVGTASRLESHLRRIVGQAKGLSTNQMELVESVSQHDGWQGNEVCFNLALHYRSLFGNDAAQAFCLSMLEHYPAGYQDYLNYFGVKNAFEENRIQALFCEKGKNSYDAQHFWRQCIAILKQNLPENDKKIAMILRHMADNVSREEAKDLLIESLDYAPDHRDSYHKIVSFYDRDKPNPAQYEYWLERSRNCFPEDAELLADAAKSALKRKAFKQALGYAQALLEIDPENALAKQILFNDHIGRARRLIRSEQFESAQTELQAAEQWAVDKDSLARLDLLRGFYTWLAQDQQQGRRQISEALEKLDGDPVIMQFRAAMEAALLNQPCPITFTIHDHLLPKQQLLRLMNLIAYYDEQTADRKPLLKALEDIKEPVKSSIEKLVNDEPFLLSWCGVLENIGYFELLQHCVDLAIEKGQKPIWYYYQTLVVCRGDASRLDHVTLFQLQNAMATARAESDSQAVLLIGRLIEQHQIASNPLAFPAELAEEDDFDQVEDLYEALFGHLSAEVMEKLEQKVQDIMLGTDPEQFAEQTVKRYSKVADSHTLTLLFDDPDFFASASLLAAAEMLQIDAGVSFEDVVTRFEHTLA